MNNRIVTTTQKHNAKKKNTDVRTGIALAITFFATSIFLYLRKDYFGFVSNIMSIVCIVIGFMGIGLELNNITNKKLEKIIDIKKGPEVFNNLGIGIGIFIVWVALYQSLHLVLVNILISPLFFFSVYGMTLGLVNLLFAGIVNRNKMNANQTEVKSLWLLAVKISTVISGIIGFIASLIQILQYLKII
jgi:hypothetical protein